MKNVAIKNRVLQRDRVLQRRVLEVLLLCEMLVMTQCICNGAVIVLD